MPIDTLCIIGAGGHAKVVVDAWLLNPAPDCDISVFDENPRKTGTLLIGSNTINMLDLSIWAGAAFHVAIGSNAVRASLHDRLTARCGHAVSILHPNASVAASATIGDGSFVAAFAILAPDARIGSSTIINHGAIVDHDCTVGSFSHIGPNATLGGSVVIGSAVLVGAGATILPGVRVGDRAVIAAGSTIVRDVDPGETVIFSQVRKTRKP